MRKLLILLSIGVAALSVSAAPVVVLFQDSTGALLPNVAVSTCRHTTDTTSWDGVLKFDSSLLPMKLSAKADGYFDQSVRLSKSDAGKTIFLIMKSKPSRKPTSNGELRVRGLGSSKMTKAVLSEEAEVSTMTSGVYYSVATDRVDGAVYAAPVAIERSFVEPTADGSLKESVVEEKPDMLTGYKPNAAAGMLTAGEVNDYAKWHLWPNILTQSHKQYISDWRLLPNQRYICQLTNSDGYPLANRSVQLTDDKGVTLFQARTDNTGTAELWYNLIDHQHTAAGQTDPAHQDNRPDRSLYLVAEGQKVVALPSDKGRNSIVISEACDAPDVADVFFIMDATGSMGDELRYLREEMKDVIRRSQTAVEGLTIRTGALVYRDHHDSYLTRISRLSEDINDTQSFLDKQEAGGGGDYEEAVPEALMAACNAAGWSDEARTRIAFLILDAPCHKDSATIALLHEQVLNAAALGIRLVPVVCSGLGESGELLLRSMALATNGTSFFLTDDSGIGEKHLKPTTDTLKVEHLNDMMVRTIVSFCRMPKCDKEQWAEESIELSDLEQFLPAPFNPSDLDSVPALGPKHDLREVLQVRPNPCVEQVLVDLPLGAEALYLCDVSGKVITRLPACQPATMAMPVHMGALPTGVYFIKAFVDGRWYTAKLIKV